MYPWGDDRRFNSYSGYFRRTFGGRVQKLSVNAGFTCPNRDGTVGIGGCTFCDNSAFTPSYCTPSKSVKQQLEEGIEFHVNRYRRAEKYLAYFQSFSNTHAPVERLREIYSQVFEVPGVVGVVVGTRPDCIDADRLDLFAELAEKYYVAIEYGVESCYDKTLRDINRGHSFGDARRAIEMTSERGIHTGAHFILGLPGESKEMLLEQCGEINSLRLDTVKFHQLQIFRDTPMGEDYDLHPEKYRLFDLPEYIDLFCDITSRLRPGLVIERFASEAPPRFLKTSAWGLIRNEQLLAMFEKRLKERDLWQGKCLPTQG